MHLILICEDINLIALLLRMTQVKDVNTMRQNLLHASCTDNKRYACFTSRKHCESTLTPLFFFVRIVKQINHIVLLLTVFCFDVCNYLHQYIVNVLNAFTKLEIYMYWFLIHIKR